MFLVMFKKIALGLTSIFLGCSIYAQSFKDIEIPESYDVPVLGEVKYDYNKNGNVIKAKACLEDYLKINVELKKTAYGQKLNILNLKLGDYELNNVELRKHGKSYLIKLCGDNGHTNFFIRNIKNNIYFEYRKHELDGMSGDFIGVKKSHYVGARVLINF